MLEILTSIAGALIGIGLVALGVWLVQSQFVYRLFESIVNIYGDVSRKHWLVSRNATETDAKSSALISSIGGQHAP